MMTPQFGAAFVPISSLLPAGNVTLSGGFDDGDPRAFVAAMSSVVSYALGSASVDLVATYPPIGQAAPVETASDRDGAVIALLPPDSAVVGIPTMNATSGGASQVVSCGRVGGCTVMTSIRVPGRAGLAVSPTLEVDHLLLVYGASTLFVSADAGRSFRVLALPGQATIMSAAMAASNAWLVTQTGGDVRVRRITPAAASWPEGARDISPPLGKSGRVLALDQSRLLYLASGQGYLCSLDGGSSWTTGCPA
jgi:hypothetical protein